MLWWLQTFEMVKRLRPDRPTRPQTRAATLLVRDLSEILVDLDDRSAAGIPGSAVEIARDRGAPRTLVDGMGLGTSDALVYRLFFSCVERSLGRPVAVHLQPVHLVAHGPRLYAERLPGTRLPLDETEHPGDRCDPVRLDDMRLCAQRNLLYCIEVAGRAGGTGLVRRTTGPGLPRDPSRRVAIVFYALALGSIQTHMDTRACLADAKTSYDTAYADAVVAARATAESARDITAQTVLDQGRQTEEDTTSAFRRMKNVQRCASAMRREFAEMKPAGFGPNDPLWFPHLRLQALTAQVVARVYQARDDLRTLRHETNDSLTLITQGDSSSQLLAVRGLLQRTEQARDAAIVVGGVTVVLAAIALSVGIAAIPPASEARFAPAGVAASLAGVLIVLTGAFGTIVALSSKVTLPRKRWRAAALAAGVSACLATASFALVLADIVPSRVGLALGGVLLAACIVLVAIAGDFGADTNPISPSRGEPDEATPEPQGAQPT